MPNLLSINLDGFPASSRQMYPSMFWKILSRAAIHESINQEDAFSYIGSSWPNIILISDAGPTRPEHQELLTAMIDWVKHGGTLVFMGFFSSTVDYDRMDAIFKEELGLRWRVAAYTSHDVRLLHNVDENMIRSESLVPNYNAKAVFLGHVPSKEVVYAAETNLAYAAFARVGLGKVGYIGDVNFGEEPEKVVLAMCHLDRSEDSLEGEDGLS